MVKNPPAMREILIRSLGQEDPLEKEKATHSSILAWRIPWTYSRRESDTTEQPLLSLQIRGQFLQQRQQTNPEVKWTHWDHRSVYWGGDLTLCQCARPPDRRRRGHALCHHSPDLGVATQPTSHSALPAGWTWHKKPPEPGKMGPCKGGLTTSARGSVPSSTVPLTLAMTPASAATHPGASVLHPGHSAT